MPEQTRTRGSGRIRPAVARQDRAPARRNRDDRLRGSQRSPWIAGCLAGFAAFPMGRRDDQVDSTAQAARPGQAQANGRGGVDRKIGGWGGGPRVAGDSTVTAFTKPRKLSTAGVDADRRKARSVAERFPRDRRRTSACRALRRDRLRRWSGRRSAGGRNALISFAISRATAIDRSRSAGRRGVPATIGEACIGAYGATRWLALFRVVHKVMAGLDRLDPAIHENAAICNIRL